MTEPTRAPGLGTMTPYLSVVIPAYNESQRLGATVQSCAGFLQDWASSWEILVVDDGSTDGTAAVVERLAASEPRVRLIRAPHSGKGAAVRRGMIAACGSWRFFADADLSMDLQDLSRFFEVPADVAIGSREVPGSRRIGEPLWRHIVGRAFNVCVRLLAVRGIRDTQCGYKLFTAEAAARLFGTARLNGFAFDVELLFLARRAGLRVREVPITWRHRSGTRVNLRTGVVGFFQILQIRWNDLLGRYDHGLRGAH